MSSFPVILKYLVSGKKEFFNDRPHVCSIAFLLSQVNTDVIQANVHWVSLEPGCSCLVVRVPVNIPV